MNRTYFTDLSLILVAIIWALNFSIIKVTLEQLDPFSFNGLRFLFAGGTLYLALRIRGQKLKFRKKDWPGLLGMAILGNVFYQVTFIVGIDFTLSANAAVMLGTIPVWVALFSHLFTDEKISRINSFGVILAFTGVFLIIIGGNNELSFASETFIGDLICILASMFWAIYTILSKRFLKVYTPLQYSSLMAMLGAFLLFMIGLPSLVQVNWSAVTLPSYGAILYSGALSVGLAYLIWNNGLVKIGAVRTATYQNLVPVLGLIFGVVLLNEELTWIQYVGASLVICGIILSRR